MVSQKIRRNDFEKSLTFTELLGETGFAKSTLTTHLSDLKESGIIEKALEKDRVVYRLTLNEEKILINIPFNVIKYLLINDLLYKIFSKPEDHYLFNEYSC